MLWNRIKGFHQDLADIISIIQTTYRAICIHVLNQNILRIDVIVSDAMFF